MSILQSLESRRTYYALNDQLPVSEQEVVTAVERAVALTPDAFDMKSARAVVLLGGAHKALWSRAFDDFGGKVPREKLDGFAAGAGTVLYYTDDATVQALQEQFAAYADNFPTWAAQANGMTQLAVWAALRDLNVGASLQHYNPVIDQTARELAGVPESYRLVAEMPFGGIAAEPDAKAAEDISKRVSVVREA